MASTWKQELVRVCADQLIHAARASLAIGKPDLLGNVRTEQQVIRQIRSASERLVDAVLAEDGEIDVFFDKNNL